MRNWFELNKPYHFETNDIIALLNLFNTFAVIAFGLIASWFGLAIAILNAYFLMTFYNIL